MRVRQMLFVTFTCAVAIASASEAVRQATVAGIAAAPDQTLAADGVTLRYREVGTGEPVLLIHGYAGSLETLSPVADALAPSHRVAALDVRGFGKSTRFADANRFGKSMVDDVVRLMDHLKVARAHLVGHSMGALIAANAAARYPSRVMSASLIAGPFYADYATFSKEVAPWVDDLENGKGLTNFIHWLFPAMPMEAASGFSAQAMKMNDEKTLIAVLRSLPDLAVPSIRDRAIPSLVVVGTGDPLLPQSRAFAKASPGARLLEIDGADHATIVSRKELIAAIRDLIERARKTLAKEAA